VLFRSQESLEAGEPKASMRASSFYEAERQESLQAGEPHSLRLIQQEAKPSVT